MFDRGLILLPNTIKSGAGVRMWTACPFSGSSGKHATGSHLIVK
jgi:hypothetical protein